MTTSEQQRHRVVVVGGGFGGLNAVRSLAHADVDVTVVDRANHHLFQPLLYQVAAGILPPGLIAPALRSVIKKQRNARALLAQVTDLDLEHRVVRAEGPDDHSVVLPYDTLVVAGGATHSYFGRDEFARYTPGMKTIEDARYLRDRILVAFETAELCTDPQERAEWLTFVVIGAGPTGVELVGQVAELAHKVLPQDYRSVDTREARILLLEGAGAVLGPFDEKLRRYTHERLERMGVEIKLNTLATDMDDSSVTVKGPDGAETIRTRTRIWAAGVQASPLAAQLADHAGLETDRAGRIPVKGSMATIGHRSAVADAFGMKFTGVIGYTMWGLIHVLYLIGWGNRLGTLYTWARALTFSNNRGHRIITFRQAAEPPPDEDCRPAETAVRPVDLRQPQAMHFPHRPQRDPGLRRQEET
jgi:NADH dehydrogenase